MRCNNLSFPLAFAQDMFVLSFNLINYSTRELNKSLNGGGFYNAPNSSN